MTEAKERIIGLDLGKGSVGWAVVEFDHENKSGRIIDCGVRIFPAADIHKAGESPNKPRREARGARRRLRRRAYRLRRIRLFLIEQGVLSAAKYLRDDEPDIALDGAFDSLHRNFAAQSVTPWQLRYEALQRKLTVEEWAVVLIHLAQRRGFRSNSKREESGDKEAGKMKKAISANKELMNNKGYRTLGEMFYLGEEYHHAKRNKSGEYRLCVERGMVKQEIETLFQHQQQLGNPHASDVFYECYAGIWSSQRHFDQGGNIEKMIARCTFEPDQPRAPRRSYSHERFMLLQRVINLRYRGTDGELCSCTPEQRRQIIDRAYQTEKLTYAAIRALLSLSANQSFLNLRYHSEKDKKEEWKDPEKEIFVQLHGWHALRKAIVKIPDGKTLWEQLATNPDKIDTIAKEMTYHKDDKKITENLHKEEIDQSVIDAILPLTVFKTVGHLSLMALRKITKKLEIGLDLADGLTYDKACKQAGYQFQRRDAQSHRGKTLPRIPAEEIRNPIVVRALTQTRKVLNAIIRQHGLPHLIHIELLRDVAHSDKENKKIEKGQEEYKKSKKLAREHFIDMLKRNPSASELAKFRLAKEQDWECPYSGKSIDPAQLIDEVGYVEIDHILPFSRSWDNSLNNQVLCLAAENQNKRGKTPYEYFGNDQIRWQQFVERTRRYKSAKRNRLIRTSFTDAEAKEHQQRTVERSESKYISKFMAQFIGQHLLFAPSSHKCTIRTRNGTLTAFLRHHWGLASLKDRRASDTHHALDAIIVACSSEWMLQNISTYAKNEQLWAHHNPNKLAHGTYNERTGEIKNNFVVDKRHKWQFPLPWPAFRDEVAKSIAQLAAGDSKQIVSRPPRGSLSGQVHQETIHSTHPKRCPQGQIRKRILLENLTLKNIESLADKETLNNALYRELRNRLEQHKGDAKKAFTEPFLNPVIHGAMRPEVRKVTIQEAGGGMQVRGGIAGRGDMLRVDIFSKSGQFYAVPVYPQHRLSDTLPNYAVKSGAPEEQWPNIDNSYAFLFSLHIDDLVRVEYRSEAKGAYSGYFKGLDRVNGTITLKAPDRSWGPKNVGIQNLLRFTKYQVDVLGGYYPIKKETRLGLAKPTYRKKK